MDKTQKSRTSWFSPKKFESSSPSDNSSSSANRKFSDDRLATQTQPLAEEILIKLQSMSVDKLRKLLKDRDSYNAFAQSLDLVKIQTSVYGELQMDVLRLARENSANISLLTEITIQCEAIRSKEIEETELKLNEAEKQMEEIMGKCSSISLISKLQDEMDKTEEESARLRKKLLANEMEISEFLQSYKEMRALYHKRDLLHQAAMSTASLFTASSPLPKTLTLSDWASQAYDVQAQQ